MPPLPRSLSVRSLVDIGLETLPWIGLAAVSLLLPTSVLEGPAPYLHVLPALLILMTGAVVLWGRRQWSSSALAPSPPSGAPQTQSTTVPSGDSSSRDQVAPRRSPQTQSRDALTGLTDRTHLLDKLSEALAHAANDSKSSPENPALLTLRTDEYQEVTESFGHKASQDLLTAVATRIADVPPPSATVARIAEDTFAVLLPEVESRRAQEVGENLKDRVESPFNIAGNRVPVEVSIGLAIRPSPDSMFDTAEEMLQASYSAMHQVQRQDGDNLIVFQNGTQKGAGRLQRRERLRQAIREDELILYYQPIVHLVSGDAVGAEALVRWNHPDRGVLSPAAFIPLAEETGLIEELDRWVFNKALEDAERWTNGPGSSLDWISVNVSPQSAEGDLQAWCLHKLSEASILDGSLHLEITERWALRDERPLQPLRDEGVRLSIDDFGTGYSSLRYLRSLNADVLKIDSEFIQDLGRDEKTTAIVQFLLNLSLRLDVEVIAEGVETDQQASILRNLGCAVAQGYHFSRPVPSHRLVERAESTTADTSPPNEDVVRPA
jgi:diguanylate cyclase (GGDEF)-like protein